MVHTQYTVLVLTMDYGLSTMDFDLKMIRSGRIVYSEKMTDIAGSTIQKRISVGNFHEGLYILKATSGKKTLVRKFVR